MTSRRPARAFLRRAVRAEASKATSLPHAVILAILLMVAFPLLSVPIIYYQLVPANADTFTTIWPGVDVSFALVGGLQASYLLLPSLVVLSITADGNSGFTMLETVAIPTRSIHVAGKLITLLTITSVTVITGGAIAVIAGRATLHLSHQPVVTTIEDCILAVARLTLSSILIAIVTAGITYAIRHTGIALATSVSLLLVLPLLLTFMPGLNDWSAALPSTAAERLTLPTYAPPTSNWHDPGRPGALAILMAWAALLLTTGWLRYCRSDTQHP